MPRQASLLKLIKEFSQDYYSSKIVFKYRHSHICTRLAWPWSIIPGAQDSRVVDLIRWPHLKYSTHILRCRVHGRQVPAVTQRAACLLPGPKLLSPPSPSPFLPVLCRSLRAFLASQDSSLLSLEDISEKVSVAACVLTLSRLSCSHGVTDWFVYPSIHRASPLVATC